MDNDVYIVGFSLTPIECSPPKIEFLSGLGYAIYVAAFDLDDQEMQVSEGRAAELDKKEAVIRTDPTKSSLNLAGLVDEDLSSGKAAPEGNLNRSAGSTGSIGSDVGLVIDSPARGSEPSPAIVAARNGSMDDLTKIAKIEITPKVDAAPAWDTGDDFSFPLMNLPVKQMVDDNLTLDNFKEVKHLADGSNANVFTAIFRGEQVIIKMIKKDVQYDPVALHEFDAEHGMLARVSHPNIIRILGAGKAPRRFVVLEWLGGGSLNSVLNDNQDRNSFTKVFFRKPSFTYDALLNRAKDIAEALDYLHSRCYPGATIIHRDLKPDNVGFMSDGTLKLFDLGLCTCVKRRTDSNTTYKMTGNTGSLRYMAPEVALRKAYNEKVDVYSFGIMIWQMASDKIPFKGFSRDQFMKEVVIGKARPKLDSSWPTGFSNLLNSCWHHDPNARPSFSTVILDLNSLIGDNGTKKRGKVIRPSADVSKEARPSSSTWF